MMMALRPDLVARDRTKLAKSNRTRDVKDLLGLSLAHTRRDGRLGRDRHSRRGKRGEGPSPGIADEIAGKLVNEEMWSLPYLSEPVA